MTRSTKSKIALIVATGLAACAPRGKAYGPVPDQETALHIASIELERDFRRAILKVDHVGQTWIVDGISKPGDPHATLKIDELTGRVTGYTDDVVDVALIKPSATPPAAPAPRAAP